MFLHRSAPMSLHNVHDVFGSYVVPLWTMEFEKKSSQFGFVKYIILVAPVNSGSETGSRIESWSRTY